MSGRAEGRSHSSLSIDRAEGLFDTALDMALEPGTRHEPGAPIARGGMGEIVAAQQPAIRREVAMKTLLPEGDESARARFIEEAQITGQLEHPNIVPVHELAIDERGRPYYTMKLVRGTTVARIIEGLSRGEPHVVAQYPLSALLTVFQKACDAVAFAHSRGVIHRDLKPANMMVGDYGEVLVMDWGVAKVLGRERPAADEELSRITTVRSDDADLAATMAGAVLGTPHYMAPEQARGEAEAVDERSDIYALGACLYHMLTWRAPVEGTTAQEIVANVAEGKTAVLGPIRGPARDGAEAAQGDSTASIPESLAAVIRKAMAFRPADRYASVLDLQKEIAAYQGGFATAAEKATAWKRSLLFIGRHKAASMSVAASVVLIALLSSAFLVKILASERRADRARRDAEQAAAWLQAERAETLFRAGDTGTAIPYLANILRRDPKNALAAQRLMSALSRRSFPLPAQVIADFRIGDKCAAFSPDGKMLAIGSARTFDNRGGVFNESGKLLLKLEVEGTTWSDAILQLSWSDTGNWLATGTGSGARVWDPAAHRPVTPPLAHASRVFGLALDPQRTRLLTTSGDKISTIWDIKAAKPLLTVRADFAQAWASEWHPSGDRILHGTRDGTFNVSDASDGHPLVTAKHPGGLSAAHFSHDGKWIATAGSSDQTVRVWDAYTGARAGKTLELKGASPWNACFSPDDSQILAPDNNRDVHLYDWASGAEVTSPLQHRGAVSSAEFSNTGLQILTGSNTTARVWDAETSQALCEPLRHTGRLFVAKFSPEGCRVVTAAHYEDEVRVWDVRPGGAQPLALYHTAPITCLRWNADGSRLVTAAGDVAQLWDPRSGRRIGEPMHHGKKVNWAEFSPDGKRIATASDDRTAHFWDAATGAPVGRPMEHPAAVYAAQFTPGGDRLFTCTSEAGKYLVTIWDVATGKRLDIRTAKSWFHHIEFSHDGKRLLFPYRSSVLPDLADSRTGKVLSNAGLQSLSMQALRVSGVTKATFSSDDSKVATAADDWTARVWSGIDGQPITPPLQHDQPVVWADFSPDGQRVVSASLDGTAKLWNASSGELLTEPLQHPAGVRIARFSPNGRRILTACDDGAVRIWDSQVGQIVSEPLMHGGRLIDVQFHPDGRAIASAGADGVVRVWAAIEPPLPVPSWLPDLAEAACGTALDSRGVATPVKCDRLMALKTELPTASGDFYGRWVDWFFADRSARTVSPGLDLRVPEYVAGLIEADTPESLRAALLLAPQHPLALARFARRLVQSPAKPSEADHSRAAWLAALAARLAPADEEIARLNREIALAHR